jgi:hypothetical protein
MVQMPRLRTRLAAIAAFGAVFLGACSEPQYEYVRNTDVRAAFKIPTGWASFSEQELLGLGSGPQADTPDPLQWLVGLDGDPEASVAHVLDRTNLAADHPQGLVMVQDLSFVERDAASIQYLRNFIFPVDQLLQNSSDAQIIEYDDDVQREGFRGVHLVYQFRAAALDELAQAPAEQPQQTAEPNELQRALLGGAGVGVLSPDFVQVSQRAYLDPSSNRVYFMVVLCSADCFSRNRDDIEATVDSWTVLP